MTDNGELHTMEITDNGDEINWELCIIGNGKQWGING